MGDENLAVQLARMEERLLYIAREQDEAKRSRKATYEKMEEQSQTLILMDGRMQKVEESLKTQAPTIEEFITIKHKVQGAGAAGKWIWGAAGSLLGMVGLIAAAKTGLITLLTGK